MGSKSTCLLSLIVLAGLTGDSLALTGWWNQDINTSGGSATETADGFIVTGDGADIWDNTDSFHYVYKVLQGNGSITARVVSQRYTSDWAKAGVMIRETLGSASRHSFMAVTPTIDHGVAFQNRTVTGGPSYSAHTNPLALDSRMSWGYPCWVRIVRQGDWLSGYMSADGVNWRLIPPSTSGDGSPNPRVIPMANQVYIGLAVTSHWGGLLSSAEFDNVSHTGNVSGKAAPSKASRPNPPDGATGVLNPLLTWTAGGMAVWHNVYLGTSPNLTGADLKASRQTETMYWYAPGFQPGVTYYWRVDEIGADGSIYPGDIWHFSARGRIAYDPVPADGAVAVELNPVLTWEPGEGATRHQVFFGTSFQAVEAGTGATNKGSTTTPQYVPGWLDIKTTYYWRVDEYDVSRLFQGQVWSFTTRGRPGGLKAQYYSDRDLQDLALTRIDPDINFWWGLSSPDPQMSADNFSVRWTGEIEIPFSESYTFITRSDDGVRLYVNNRLVINNWTDHSVTDNYSEPIPLVAGQTYPIRMEFYENLIDAIAILEWQSPSTPRQLVPSDLLSPPYRASNPRPANLSAVSKSAKVILSWSRGEKATEHDIYFGDVQQMVRQANTADKTGIYRGRQTDTTYSLPDVLQSDKTYYWRIDELNTDGTITEGNLWSFTVGEYGGGDDFETNDFSKFPWQRGGGPPWTTTSKESHSGMYSARAGQINDEESSSLVLTQNVQDGILTFWCKVSCESGSDHLEFSIDGIKKGEWTGELDWQAVSFPVNAGVRTFTWTYIKDSSSASGQDTAWIDDVALPL